MTRIFYDVDTQNDFMCIDGALYVPDAVLIRPNLKELTDFAREHNIPIIGSVDRHFGTPEYKHREVELARWGGKFPDHCMDDKEGIMKIEETRLETPYGGRLDEGSFIAGAGYTWPHFLDNSIGEKHFPDIIRDLTKRNKRWKIGFYFEKQHYDVFTNPAFEKFLEIAEVDEAVVYGVATDYCVRAAVLGMQNRKIQCYVVKDAIKGVDPNETKAAIDEMEHEGAKFVTTRDVLYARI